MPWFNPPWGDMKVCKDGRVNYCSSRQIFKGWLKFLKVLHMKDLRFFLLVSSLKSKGVDAAIFMRAHSSSRCCLTNDVLFFTEGRLFTGVAAGSFQDEAYRKLHRKDTQSSRSTVPNVAQAKQEEFNPTEITEMRPKRKSLSLSSLFRNLNIPSLFPFEQQNIKVWDFPAKWNGPVFAQK